MSTALPPIGYASRPDAVRAALGGATLVVSTPSNIRWLTSFGGSLGWVVVGPERCSLVTDGRYAERAAADLAAAGLADAVDVVVGTTRPQIRDHVVALAGRRRRQGRGRPPHARGVARPRPGPHADARCRHDRRPAPHEGRRRAGPHGPRRRDRRHRADRDRPAPRRRSPQRPTSATSSSTACASSGRPGRATTRSSPAARTTPPARTTRRATARSSRATPSSSTSARSSTATTPT